MKGWVYKKKMGLGCERWRKQAVTRVPDPKPKLRSTPTNLAFNIYTAPRISLSKRNRWQMNTANRWITFDNLPDLSLHKRKTLSNSIFTNRKSNILYKRRDWFDKWTTKGCPLTKDFREFSIRENESDKKRKRGWIESISLLLFNIKLNKNVKTWKIYRLSGIFGDLAIQ